MAKIRINTDVRAVVAVAVVASALAYGWVVVFGEFFSDDFTWLWHGKKIGLDLGKMFSYRMSSFFSPVLNAFYSLAFLAVGPEKGWYFLAGLAVHAANAALAGLLHLRLGGTRLQASLTAVAIAVAGAAFEPVIWVGSNLHSFAALFIVSSVHFYLSFLRNGRWGYALAAVLSCGLAYMTKETAIVAFPLLLGVAFVERRAPCWRSRAHAVLASVLVLVTAAYAVAEYFWQKSSMTVAAGLWHPSAAELVRLPLVLVDQVVPLAAFSPSVRFAAVAVAAVAFAYAAFRQRLPKAVVYGLWWGVIASLPTIFFKTEGSWMPLTSRYGYLPRLGTVMAAVALVFLLSKKRALAAAVVAVFIAYEVAFAAVTIKKEYPYVYATGRTLTAALEEARERGDGRLVVLPDRPFENNPAHLVGAADVFMSLPEEKIIFVGRGEPVPVLAPGDAALRWDAEERAYQLLP